MFCNEAGICGRGEESLGEVQHSRMILRSGGFADLRGHGRVGDSCVAAILDAAFSRSSPENCAQPSVGKHFGLHAFNDN